MNESNQHTDNSDEPDQNRQEYKAKYPNFRWRWHWQKPSDKAIVIVTFVNTILTFGLLAYYACYFSAYKEATHVETRAYVIANNFQLTVPDASRKPMFVDWNLSNNGKTPACEFKIHIGCYFDTSGNGIIPDTTFIDCDRRTPNEGGSVLGVGTEIQRFPIKDSIPLYGIQQVQSGKVVIFVYGNLVYQDKFGENRYTHFCWFYNPKRGMVAYDKHNDAN